MLLLISLTTFLPALIFPYIILKGEPCDDGELDLKVKA